MAIAEAVERRQPIVGEAEAVDSTQIRREGWEVEVPVATRPDYNVRTKTPPLHWVPRGGTTSGRGNKASLREQEEVRAEPTAPAKEALGRHITRRGWKGYIT